MTTPLYTQPIAIRQFSSRAAWEAYAGWLRRQVKISLALLPEPARMPLNPRVFDQWTDGHVTCSKVAFESLPGFYVTGNLYQPAEITMPVPGILSPHGHWPQGRLQDYSPLGSGVGRAYNLALQGSVTLAYDMVGYADSCQLPHSFPTDAPWGLSLMALQTWNSVRALDFLQSLPGVDPQRLACTGESGGGTQTFTLAAVDERLTVAAPIVMVSSIFHGGCLCENAPLLRVAANNVELARLFAPKPQFVGSCTGDWTCNVKTVELPAIGDIYRFYRAEKALDGLQVDMEHNYAQPMRESVYTFFKKHLHGRQGNKPVSEVDFGRPPMAKQMVWWGREAPEPISYDDFHTSWRARMEATLQPSLATAEIAREKLGALLSHIIVLTEESLADYQRKAPKHITVKLKGQDLFVEPKAAKLPAEAADRDYLTYHRAPHAEAVLEILAALANTGATRLHGTGTAGAWCLLAAALASTVVSVEADVTEFDPNDDAAWETHLSIPAIRQLGGLATIFAMIGPRQVTLQGANETMRELAARYAVG